MAEKSWKKSITRVTLLSVAFYFVMTSFFPLWLATKWKSRTSGIGVSDLEKTVARKGIPQENLGGAVFLKVHEDYLRRVYDAGARYISSPRIICFPDANSEDLQYNLDDSLSQEIGHHVYSNLTREQRDRVEKYALKYVEGTFKILCDVDRLRKERDLAKKSGEEEKARYITDKILVLNRYVVDTPVDKEMLTYFFSADEVFANLYEGYFNDGYEAFVSDCRERRIKCGVVDKPELEDIMCEGIKMIKDMVPKDMNSNPKCVLVNAEFPDIIGVLPRYWNPLSIAKTLWRGTDRRQFDKKTERIGEKYNWGNISPDELNGRLPVTKNHEVEPQQRVYRHQNR